MSEIKPFSAYHIHVYFDSGSRASAESLREALRRAFAGQVRVHELIDEAIGPHPLPMFEVDVPAENLEAIRSWLTAHHGTHSILIHPLSGDDLADHRDFAQWVGPPLPLDLEFLKNFRR
jgi:DOPA 4,5-dioxygenase